MKSLLLRAMPLALCLAPSQPILAQVPAHAAETQPVQLTAAQWREDLAFMVAEMRRRHPSLYHSVSREAFDAAVADLQARIPSLQRHEIIVGLMRIVAMVGDGHTRVDPRKDTKFGFPSLPLKLYLFDDGLFVRAAKPAFAELVGAEIVAVGGVPVAEAIRRTHAISSVDNAIGYRLFAPLYLNMPDILHALKLSPTREAAVLTLRQEGRTRTVTVPAGEVDPVWPPDTDISLVTPEGWVDARTAAQPLWLQAPLDYHRLIELPERKAIYAQLNMVTNEKDQTLAEFGKAIAQRAAATDANAVVLDLRLNLGGNGNLRSGLVRELIRAEDEDTKLYVLTRRGTFSASQFILDDLDRLTDATIVGEPASSKPSSFGDSYRTALPNSGISMRTSIYWWQSGQNRHPWTWVDIAAPLAFADYAAGRDPALEAALRNAPRPPLRERLAAAAAKGGTSAVLQALRSYRADPANRYANLGQQMAQAAEALHNAGHRDEGFAVAQVTARDFPANIDAALVLAHLADLTGHPDVARREAQRVLALDPHNRTVRPLLERLQQEQKK